MPRISMKLTASVVGSLALLLAAACERRMETTPEPAPGTTNAPQDPNSLRPTPSTSNNSASPGGTSAPGSTSSPSSGNTNPSAAAATDDTDTVPVRGTDPEMQGGGAGGAGHGGKGGQAGHGGKSGH